MTLTRSQILSGILILVIAAASLAAVGANPAVIIALIVAAAVWVADVSRNDSVGSGQRG